MGRVFPGGRPASARTRQLRFLLHHCVIFASLRPQPSGSRDPRTPDRVAQVGRPGEAPPIRPQGFATDSPVGVRYGFARSPQGRHVGDAQRRRVRPRGSPSRTEGDSLRVRMSVGRGHGEPVRSPDQPGRRPGGPRASRDEVRPSRDGRRSRRDVLQPSPSEVRRRPDGGGAWCGRGPAGSGSSRAGSGGSRAEPGSTAAGCGWTVAGSRRFFCGYESVAGSCGSGPDGFGPQPAGSGSAAGGSEAVAPLRLLTWWKR